MIKSRSRSFLLYFVLPLIISIISISVFSDDVEQSFIPSNTDISVKYLAHIFGNVGDALPGQAGSILGTLFGIFNTGIISMTGVFLTYTTMRAIIDTAHDGEALGKKISHWAIVRSVGGVGLLAPQASGYSILQVFVMWVAVQGVGFANLAWNKTVDFVEHGGLLYTHQRDNQNNTENNKEIEKKKKNSDDTIDRKFIYDAGSPEHMVTLNMLRGLVSMHYMENAINFYNNKVLETHRDGIYDITTCQSISMCPACKTDTDKCGVVTGDNKYYVTNCCTNVSGNVKNLKLESRVVFSEDDSNIKKKFYHMEHPESIYSIYVPYGVCEYKVRDALTNEDISYFDNCSDSNGAKYPSKVLDFMSGVFQYGWTGKNGDTIYEKDKQVYIPAKQQAINNAFQSLDSVARSIVNSKIKDDDYYLKSEDNRDLVAKTLLNVGNAYQGAVHNARIEAGSEHDYKPKKTIDKEKEKPLEDAKKLGWSSAGSFYFNLVDASDSSDRSNILESKLPYTGYVEKQANQDSMIKMPEGKWADPMNGDNGANIQYTSIETLIKGCNPDILSSFRNNIMYLSDNSKATGGSIIKKIDDMITEIETPIEKKDKEILQENRKNVISKLKGTDAGGVMLSRGDAIVTPWFFVMYDHVRDNFIEVLLGEESAKNRSTSTFPLNRLSQFGASTINDVCSFIDNVSYTAFGVMVGSDVASTLVQGWIVSGTAGGIGASLFNSGYSAITAAVISLVNQGIKTVKDTLLFFPMANIGRAMPVVIIFFTLGTMLKLYIPYYPYIIYTFAVVSWCVFVVEAMTAAPLVALGLTHPEGHDILGKSEQAVMLLTALFVRPICILIGFIVAINMSYVFVEIVNTGFFNIVSYNAKNNENMQVFIIVCAMCMYIYIMIAGTKYVFDLIIDIPAYILRWIGVSDDTIRKVKEATQEVGQGMTQAFSTAQQGLTDMKSNISSIQSASSDVKLSSGTDKKALQGSVKVE